MQAWQRYMQNSIMTSNPIKNTILIYEKSVAEFRNLGELLNNFRFQEGDAVIEKLENIFEELTLQLNPDADEELYKNLTSLYEWILAELSKIKMTRTAEGINDMIYVLQQLIEGYQGALHHAEQ
ncbi:flagellar protein FliS [Ectobacillus antri]|jgi:flagellar protein FliS|uniref:Flagellar protein FliS n=1 Tax=Ectobacillus antri TaxID=2486280 RepID=A0ABT6H0H3_9BACI|nr:flagellar protein FliS [Ectobacillus antri]MDG4656190.1 flagellar protein FliS [Ectobacillus antri]MDG5752865.1 flagellar protein FliS [Ectobacillus antri]